MKLAHKLLLLSGGGATPAQLYDTRVLATSPIRYNKLNETSGTAIVDSSGNGYTATYSGVTLADTDSPFLPDKAPFWDGANDYGNLHSAAFATAFNPDEFTVMIWHRINGSSVWTDGIIRDFVRIARTTATDLTIRIGKLNTNNTITFRRTANSTTKFVDIGSQSDTGWVCYAVSCSLTGGGLLSAGELRAYKNGVQAGVTQTGALAATGSGLSNTTTVLGASSTAPIGVAHGHLSRLIIWNRPIDAAILALMTA